jgi:hypothetical protein
MRKHIAYRTLADVLGMLWIIAVAGACSLYDRATPAPDAQVQPMGSSGPTVQSLRDPQTGQCEDVVIQPGAPDWADCNFECDGTAEVDCLALCVFGDDSGDSSSELCHAAYLDGSYWGCFSMPMSGGVLDYACTGLDAQTCSDHTDCVSQYSDASGSSEFVACASKPPACSTLTTAATCAARGGCTVVSEGVDCTTSGGSACQAGDTGCTCASYVFESCD